MNPLEESHFIVRQAIPPDHDLLTRIAYSAKRHWPYPEDYFCRWKDELTITAQYILRNVVRRVDVASRAVGFYSLISADKHSGSRDIVMEEGPWLDHMYVLPAFHGKGIGTFLFADMKRALSHHYPGKTLNICVDPHATGFYERMGARLSHHSASSIPGRTIPVFQYPA